MNEGVEQRQIKSILSSCFYKPLYIVRLSVGTVFRHLFCNYAFILLEPDYAEILDDKEINQFRAETDRSSISRLPLEALPPDLELKSAVEDHVFGLKYEGIENTA